MPKSKIDTIGIYIRMSEVLAGKMDAVAMERGFSRSEYIRHLIQNAVEKEESK